MFRVSGLVSLFVPLLLLAGCSGDSGPARATWEYVELVKDEKGEVKEVGDKHRLKSGGDEMYEIKSKGKTVDVVTVTSAKAKFRLHGETAEKVEVELQAGQSKDLWLDGFGVRLRVETIGPIP